MEQGKKPRSLCSAEGARVCPPCHLGVGSARTKNLEALFKSYIEPRIPFPEFDKVPEQLDHLRKDRQVLTAQGNTVAQECRSILAEIQRVLSTLQRNAAANARRKQEAKRKKGKHL